MKKKKKKKKKKRGAYCGIILRIAVSFPRIDVFVVACY
jgi:hypothetical protein